MSSTLVFILTTVPVLYCHVIFSLVFSQIFITFRELTMPMRELEAKELFLFLAPDTDMNISVFLS